MVKLSPGVLSSVQLLPICVYMTPISARLLIATQCLAGQLSMQ